MRAATDTSTLTKIRLRKWMTNLFLRRYFLDDEENKGDSRYRKESFFTVRADDELQPRNVATFKGIGARRKDRTRLRFMFTPYIVVYSIWNRCIQISLLIFRAP